MNYKLLQFGGLFGDGRVEGRREIGAFTVSSIGLRCAGPDWSFIGLLDMHDPGVNIRVICQGHSWG